MRKINLSNESKRDAEVAFGTSFHRPSSTYKTAGGSSVISCRNVRATLNTSDATLLEKYGDGLADILVKKDPEVDIETFGLQVEDLKKVFLQQDGKVAYGVSLNEHVYLADGTEKEVRPKSMTEANIATDGFPVRWTGKLIPRDKAIRMFVFKKSYQIQHVNGLTFDFLFGMAKKLSDAKAMMLVGSGPKGIAPLVMMSGGTPYRAFLEGRVCGDRYALILRLTNLELKSMEG